jgi:hypothetical protein
MMFPKLIKVFIYELTHNYNVAIVIVTYSCSAEAYVCSVDMSRCITGPCGVATSRCSSAPCCVEKSRSNKLVQTSPGAAQYPVE